MEKCGQFSVRIRASDRRVRDADIAADVVLLETEGGWRQKKLRSINKNCINCTNIMHKM